MSEYIFMFDRYDGIPRFNLEPIELPSVFDVIMQAEIDGIRLHCVFDITDKTKNGVLVYEDQVAAEEANKTWIPFLGGEDV